VNVIGSIGLTMLLVSLFDWLFITRVAGYFSDFDYRYWPLSRIRLASLLALICTVALLVIFVRPNPDNPPLWVLIPFGIVLILWISVGYRDIAIQRRTGYRTPPRYSDGDY
jgi:hypothetical protein